MNADEFIAAVNRKAPHHLPRADREFLKRYQVVLGSGPYYQEHVPQAISLLGNEHDLLRKAKREPKKDAPAIAGRPQVAISQIIVIHNLDAKQCHKIRNGLIQTGLINFEGQVFVNFSPYTHRTIDSLPKEAFAEADYHMEYTVFEKAISQSETKPLGWAINPVFFVRDVEATLVQLTLLLGGQGRPGIGPGALLPSPLYQAFLNVSTGSAQTIMDFMNRYKVYLFAMRWDQDQLLRYTQGIDTSMQLLTPATGDKLKEFWVAEQQKMRGVLMAATQGRLGQVVFPPIFPVVEEAMVEWRTISGYFDRELAQTKVPEGTRYALFEFKEAASETMVRVRRYYGWLSYMWAELADEIYEGRAALVCERCGTVISRGKHGIPKRFCSREENFQCYKERNAEKVSASRRRRVV